MPLEHALASKSRPAPLGLAADPSLSEALLDAASPASPRPPLFQRGLSDLLQTIYDVYDLCEAEGGGRGVAMARQTAAILSDALDDFLSLAAERAAGRQEPEQGRRRGLAFEPGAPVEESAAEERPGVAASSSPQEAPPSRAHSASTLSYAAIARGSSTVGRPASDSLPQHRDGSRDGSVDNDGSDHSEDEDEDEGRSDVIPPPLHAPSSAFRDVIVPLLLHEDAEAPGSGGAGTPRSLALKLMSPDRRKRNPEETQRRLAEKQARARRLRVDMQRERLERLARVEQVRFSARQRVEQSSQPRGEETSRKLQRGEELRTAHLESIQRKAREENQKVLETYRGVQLEQELRRQALEERYSLAGQRRQERLDEIRRRQKEAELREQEARERRTQREQERLAKLEEAQQRKEQAQAKIELERRATLAALEARKQQQRQALEALQKEKAEVASRGKLQLEDRLREAEVRRLMHISQIRDKAALSGPPLPATPTGAATPSVFASEPGAAAVREGSVRRAISYDTAGGANPEAGGSGSPQPPSHGPRPPGSGGASAATASTPGGGPDVRSSYVGQIKSVDGTFVTARTFSARKSSLRERARKLLKRLLDYSVEVPEPAEVAAALASARGQRAVAHAQELQRALASLVASCSAADSQPTASRTLHGAATPESAPKLQSTNGPVTPGGSFNVWLGNKGEWGQLASPPLLPLPRSSHPAALRSRLNPGARDFVPFTPPPPPPPPSAAEAARAAASALRGLASAGPSTSGTSPPKVASGSPTRRREPSPPFYVAPEDASDPLEVCACIRSFLVDPVSCESIELHAARRSGLLMTLLQVCAAPPPPLRLLGATVLLEAAIGGLRSPLSVAHAVARGGAPPVIATTVTLLDECLGEREGECTGA